MRDNGKDWDRVGGRGRAGSVAAKATGTGSEDCGEACVEVGGTIKHGSLVVGHQARQVREEVRATRSLQLCTQQLRYTPYGCRHLNSTYANYRWPVKLQGSKQMKASNRMEASRR